MTQEDKTALYDKVAADIAELKLTHTQLMVTLSAAMDKANKIADDWLRSVATGENDGK